MITGARRSPRARTVAAARPARKASSAVSGGWLALPRMPSVPNSLLMESCLKK
jgi:hypothetical protein